MLALRSHQCALPSVSSQRDIRPICQIVRPGDHQALSYCGRRLAEGCRISRPLTCTAVAKGFGSGPTKKADSKPKKSKKGIERELCPCNSGRKYEDCCEVYHRGGDPPTIDATLRARFSAFAKKRKEYVLSTFHPDYHVVKYGTEPNGSIQQLIVDINNACDKFEFFDFQVKDFEQVDDNEGWITFQYRQYEIPEQVEPRQDIPRWLQQEELRQVKQKQGQDDKLRTRLFVERSKFVRGDKGQWQFADFKLLEAPSWLSKGYASARDAEIAGEEAQEQLRLQQAQAQ